MIMARREKKGKQSTCSQEEQMAQQVMDLFQVNAVVGLQVRNYHQLPEKVKERLCKSLSDVTLCKVPACGGKGVIFFLGKEARV